MGGDEMIDYFLQLLDFCQFFPSPSEKEAHIFDLRDFFRLGNDFISSYQRFSPTGIKLRKKFEWCQFCFQDTCHYKELV